MPGLEDLYREIILDHYRTPRNRGELPTPPARLAVGHNPLCGDEVTVYVDVEDGTVRDVKVAGQGCSISQSSASMMTQAVIGKRVGEVQSVVRRFKAMLSIDERPGSPGDPATDGADGADGTGSVKGDGSELGELEALRGVVKFPVRIKCATLAWNTLVEALDAPRDPA
ncbi:MAG: Fe-S cluster assembly sulfur transfer protein SufU [Ilumatobacteraceae bacterium]|jgi:nitrogen fixation NifU-like protein